MPSLFFSRPCPFDRAVASAPAWPVHSSAEAVRSFAEAEMAAAFPAAEAVRTVVSRDALEAPPAEAAHIAAEGLPSASEPVPD